MPSLNNTFEPSPLASSKFANRPPGTDSDTGMVQAFVASVHSLQAESGAFSRVYRAFAEIVNKPGAIAVIVDPRGNPSSAIKLCPTAKAPVFVVTPVI